MESSRRPGRTLRRINANFSPEISAVLEELADKKGVSMTEVLRQAVSLEKYVSDAQDRGGRVLVQEGDKTYELLRR